MSLVSCPECGHRISNKAISCPNCGYVLKDRRIQNLKIFCTVILGCAAIFIFLFHGLFWDRSVAAIPAAMAMAIWFYPQIKKQFRGE